MISWNNTFRFRYSDNDPQLLRFKYPCHHDTCKNISLRDLQRSRAKCYSQEDKIKQDVKLSHLLEISTPKRKRSRRLHDPKHHNLSVKYKLWVRSPAEKRTVCQKMFLSVFGVSQRRVQNIARNMKIGCGIVERRGGDHRSHKNTEKREKVKEFIANLKGHESHYGRQKSRRIYLSSEYNITKLWKAYNHSVDSQNQVKYKFFSRIFNTDFNIGFGSPSTDVCGFCMRHQTQIRLCTNIQEKSRLMTDLRVHKLRAKNFYTLIKETNEFTLSYCFDLQQVQVLPKVPIGDAFYAQQLSFYAFCVTDMSTSTPVFYTWLENQAGRGSIEVGSALYDFLTKLKIPGHITNLSLCCDGCGGQNKNNHVMHMLMIWLYKCAPPTLKSITICFPVRGHSYLPADRVFGRVEKELRAYSVLKSPQKYYEIYSKFGKVRKLGDDWKVYDFKQALAVLKKIDAISDAKRILFKRTSRGGVCMKTEQFYRNDDFGTKYQTLLKKGTTLEMIQLREVPLRRDIKAKKVVSLLKLLVQLGGDNWSSDPELAWLREVLPGSIENMPDDGVDDNDDELDAEQRALCHCHDDDGGVKV